MFDSSAVNYDSWYDTPLGRAADWAQKELIFKLAGPEQSDECLDIGCGTGNYTLALSTLVRSVTGVELSEPMIKIAEEKLKCYPNANIVKADACSLPFPDESFDLAISVTAFEFLDDPAKAAAEAFRVLRPGGRFIVGVLGLGGPWGDIYTEAAKDPENVFHHARLFTDTRLRSLLPEPALVEGALFFPPDPKALSCAFSAEYAGRRGKGIPNFLAARWIKPRY